METLIGLAIAVLAIALTLRLLVALSKAAIVVGLVGVIVLAILRPVEACTLAQTIGHVAVRLIERAVG